MSKALVIKGANFALNKVETIALTQPIPCTGLALSPTTVSLTSVGATQQLTVTKTPADTTDTLTFVSSNPAIASVSDAGLITSLGVGTVTITVMCGTQSATCTCTLTESYDIDEKYVAENAYAYGESMNLSADPPKNHISRSSNEKARLYYSTTEFGNFRAFTSTANDGKYCIPIPNGATSVTITPPAELRRRTFFVIANANEKQTYVTGADGQSALGVYPFLKSSGTTFPATIDISEYPEANGFILSITGASGTDPSTVTGHTTVVFS